MKKILVITVLLLTGAAMSQKSKPKDEVVTLTGTTSNLVTIAGLKPTAIYSEKLTKEGHYLVTFDDPNNEFRCYVTANNDMNRWEVSTFTVVCTRAHNFPDEREVKP